MLGQCRVGLGHDVAWSGLWAKDPGDTAIMAAAHSEQRILAEKRSTESRHRAPNPGADSRAFGVDRRTTPHGRTIPRFACLSPQYQLMFVMNLLLTAIPYSQILAELRRLNPNIVPYCGRKEIIKC